MVTRKPNDVIQLSKIRMREHMRKTLAREAEKNNRTLNAEIVDRLGESLSRSGRKEMDTAVVQAMAGRDPVNSELLRWIVYELQGTKPRWYLTEETTNNLADAIAEIVRRMADPSDPISGIYGSADK